MFWFVFLSLSQTWNILPRGDRKFPLMRIPCLTSAVAYHMLCWEEINFVTHWRILIYSNVWWPQWGSSLSVSANAWLSRRPPINLNRSFCCTCLQHHLNESSPIPPKEDVKSQEDIFRVPTSWDPGENPEILGWDQKSVGLIYNLLQFGWK